MEFKVLRRTVVLECYANKVAREALRDIVEPLKNMVSEMVEYALKHNASQNTLHRCSTRGIGESTHGYQQGL